MRKLLANLFGHPHQQQNQAPLQPLATPPGPEDELAQVISTGDDRTRAARISLPSSSSSPEAARFEAGSVDAVGRPGTSTGSTGAGIAKGPSEAFRSALGRAHDGEVNVNLSLGSMFNVEGLVVVVTGGGTGIGLMMAKALESGGATVYIIGRRMELLEKAAKDNSKFDKIIPLQGDVTDRESLLSIVETVKARHGFIDLLVNNAGIARNLYPHPLPSPSPGTNALSTEGEEQHGGPLGSSIKTFQNTLWECGSPEDFADTFKTNVTAVYYTTVAFLELLQQGNMRRQRLMLANQSGSSSSAVLMQLPYQTSQVLTVSSSGGFRTDAKVLSPSYTVAKAACTHMGKMLASLLAPWAIRSNVLAPGVFPSEMTTSVAPGVRLDPSVLAATVPVKRMGSEEDMAGTILFLASRAGAYVNGAVWLVDGGRVSTIGSSSY